MGWRGLEKDSLFRYSSAMTLIASYNPRKAAQVIAYFVLRSGLDGLPVVKAVKLVYLADRESLARFGFPILDEVHVSMRHGPVNSFTLDYINGEEGPDTHGWDDILKAREDHQVAVRAGVTEETLDELSEADLICLEAVWERFGAMTPWQLRDWTHDPVNVPEWENPGASSRPIPLARILTAVGHPDPQGQAQLIGEQRYIDQIFTTLQA